MVRYAAHVETDGEAFYAAIKAHGLEGMIAKRRDSRYEPGRRSREWLKIKARKEQELVVGGWEPGKGSHAELGAVLVGVYEGGELRYAGEVGSGMDTRTRAGLLKRMRAAELPGPPFANPPRLRNVHWTEPSIVIRAEFTDWTSDDLVRQSTYKGLDPTKDPRDVVREPLPGEGPLHADAGPAEGRETHLPQQAATPGRQAAGRDRG